MPWPERTRTCRWTSSARPSARAITKSLVSSSRRRSDARSPRTSSVATRKIESSRSCARRSFAMSKIPPVSPARGSRASSFRPPASPLLRESASENPAGTSACYRFDQTQILRARSRQPRFSRTRPRGATSPLLVPLACAHLNEEVEAIKARGKDRRHSVDELQRPGDDDGRARVEDALEPLVRSRTDDHVGHPGLVLEREEHMSFRRLRMLLHHDRARHAHQLAMPMVRERDGRYHLPTVQLLAVEAHDLRPRGDAGDAVIERDALALGEQRERWRVRWWQRQRRPHEGR